jgi:hypothetical protein
MMIHRRTFVVGAGSVTLAPALRFLPVQRPIPEVSATQVVFMIDGWNAPEKNKAVDLVWIRIGHSWRTAWR